MKMRSVPFTFNRAVYMQAATITIGKDTFKVAAGNDDSISVYRDAGSVYVLSENSRLDYIGLERFNRDSLDLEFDIFLQTESEDKDWLLNISRIPTKIRYLLQWDM